MNIAIIFALPAEFAPWRRRRTFHGVHTNGSDIYEAQVGRAAVRVAFSGIGAPDSRRFPELVLAGPADAVIVTGAAGGLKSQYRCGEVVVSRHLRSAADGRVVPVDERLVSAAARCGATVAGVLLTIDRIVLRAEDKAALGRTADAVDMESFLVISEAARRGIPGVAIRVIADTADEDLPLDLSAAVRADGSLSMSRAAAAVAVRPARWPRVVHAGLSYRRALGELAAFLDRFVDGLA